MRKHVLWMTMGVVTGLYVWTTASGMAQPSPVELADRIERLHAEHIRGIDQVAITSEVVDGMAKGVSSTARLQKAEKDGRPVLESVSDDDLGSMHMSGMHDGVLGEMIRKARSIERTRHEGAPTYLVTVDDVEYLKSLGEFGMDEDMDEFKPKRAQLWIDADELLVRKLVFVQDGPTGGEMQVDVVMDQYQTHRGLPIAHRVRMNITGMDQMMSSAEMEEARRNLEMMKAQLDQVPEAQRAMIESMMAPQIEQFEQMMQSGGTSMEIRVTDVSFE